MSSAREEKKQTEEGRAREESGKRPRYGPSISLLFSLPLSLSAGRLRSFLRISSSPNSLAKRESAIGFFLFLLPLYLSLL